LLVVVFCLGFGCVLVAWLLGWVDRAMLIRSAATAGISAASYLLYLRPIMGSWSGYGFAGTNVLVSFVAHVGVPTLALAALGAVIGLAAPAERKAMGWWAGLALGSVLVVAASPRIIPAWNVRYGILFTVPLWVTAALAFEYVAKRMASHWTVIGWYGLIALLLLPKLASQYRDGSTHDFRTAAAMVVADRPGDRVILTNLDFPTKYYLPKHLRRQVRSWQPGDELPAGPGYLLEGTNLWQPVPRFPGRRRVLLGQVARRRFDEQSYVVRVYRFGPKGSPDAD